MISSYEFTQNLSPSEFDNSQLFESIDFCFPSAQQLDQLNQDGSSESALLSKIQWIHGHPHYSTWNFDLTNGEKLISNTESEFSEEEPVLVTSLDLTQSSRIAKVDVYCCRFGTVSGIFFYDENGDALYQLGLPHPEYVKTFQLEPDQKIIGVKGKQMTSDSKKIFDLQLIIGKISED